MQISLEVHHEIYSRDVEGSQHLEQIIADARKIQIGQQAWCLTLDHISMLNHLCRHTFSLGPEVRLIHQYDIVKYIQTYLNELDWRELSSNNVFIINTVRCLYYSIHLPDEITVKLEQPAERSIQGVGQVMLPYTHILRSSKKLTKRLSMLFSPSPWWMHVNYNVAPEKSLLLSYILYHPRRVIADIIKRLFHACKNKLGLAK